MCGIAGIISKKNELSDMNQILTHFKKVIKHRGPNDEGMHIEPLMGCTQVRLSIVDIAGGKQPMYSANKKIGIVYNGEVYNYKELRYGLMNRGYSFQTDCDTEVILKLYEEYGTDSFKMLNGMFAFFIWDNFKEVKYLVRDHMGIKPLYIYEDNDIFIFSSEIKIILCSPKVDLCLDTRGFQDYLMFRYTHAPFTLFKNISRLSAGTYIEFKENTPSIYTYWDVEYNPIESYSISTLTDDICNTLDNIIKSQLMGEVPIGALLSGGIDSSIIAYFLRHNNAKLKTFNIGYPEINEFEFSREVAKKFELDHIEILTTPELFIKDFHRIAMHLDEPIADPACFPLFVLCEELKKHVTVILSGEGGDELFAGYPQYGKTVRATGDSKWKFSTFLSSSSYYLNFDLFIKEKSDVTLTQRYRDYFDKNGLLNGMMAYDLKTWVPEDLMMKTDKIMIGLKENFTGTIDFIDSAKDRLADFQMIVFKILFRKKVFLLVWSQ